VHCYWKVRVWDKDGNVSKWSEPAQWSMGLLKPGDWKAKWIGIDKTFANEDDTGQYRKLAARYLRKEFSITKEIKRATAYISGLGLYELYINRSKTGNMVLAPGATQYNKTVFYNSFDVTSQLTSGKNVVGVILGNGRYFAMRKDYPAAMQNFGFPKLLMQIAIHYTDGSKEMIVSDGSWKLTATGPITENNEFDGEKYDARLEMNGWNNPGFDESKWITATVADYSKSILVSPEGEAVKAIQEIKPVKLITTPKGEIVYDMGQNMVGWVKLRVQGNKGDQVTLTFAKVLDKGGNL